MDVRWSFSISFQCVTTIFHGLQIKTVANGFNSGRVYYLRASNEEQRQEIISELHRSVLNALFVISSLLLLHPPLSYSSNPTSLVSRPPKPFASCHGLSKPFLPARAVCANCPNWQKREPNTVTNHWWSRSPQVQNLSKQLYHKGRLLCSVGMPMLVTLRTRIPVSYPETMAWEGAAHRREIRHGDRPRQPDLHDMACQYWKLEVTRATNGYDLCFPFSPVRAHCADCPSLPKR